MPTKVVAHRYELKEKLGEGGMGFVYRALDMRTSSFVALKTLRDASDRDTLEMFRKEWVELAQLAHPNIVGLRDVGDYEEGGHLKPFFVMPLLSGSTLAELIRESSPRLTVERIVAIVVQVCQGLQAAHERDLIHRDLKPSNIFVLDDGTAQIIDFGLVQSSGSKSVTGLKGTWQYMAPEQTEGKKLTRAADIFSLGVAAYEALTGIQPFYRKRVPDTVEAVRLYIPPPISETNPKVSDIVSKAIHVAMAKQLIHRYASAREFGDTLQRAFNNQPIDRFDPARIQPKIKRARAAFQGGDCDFASELLMDLEAEGNVDPEITLLRAQIEESTKQKRVRHLLDAAQTRLEQDEIPLAMEKVAEILKIDPGNLPALAMQKKVKETHSQNQISRWISLAEQHLERNDFSEAWQALKEVFSLKYDEPEALRVKSELEVRERDALKARGEKEKLYSSALKASERGEISSALSTLEKLLELNRGVPGAAIPKRDKVYQAFFHNMVSERDDVDNAYAEGSRHLVEKNFERALEVCDRILSKYSNNAQFLALRLKVEDAKRQDLSSYIVEIGKAVDEEANLDRRVGLLEEACRRFPHEQQFARQLRLAWEHRDLVAAILAKAKDYEEQEQFSEAIQQWKILANTHSLYVGTEFEISQLEKMRDRQLRTEKKARLVQRIDQALENWALTEAIRLSRDALLEYPNDQELSSLEKTAGQRLERTQKAERLFEEAQNLRNLGHSQGALDLLQSALQLDQRNFKVRSRLVTLMVEQADACFDSDLPKAEAIARAAKALDPGHPSVKRLASVIAEKMRTDHVEAWVAKARELSATDNQAALLVIEQGLAEYSGDPRLIQFRNHLQNLVQRPKAQGIAVGQEADLSKRYDLDQNQLDRTSAYEPDLDRTTAIYTPRLLEPERTQPAEKEAPVLPPPQVSKPFDWSGLTREAQQALAWTRGKLIIAAALAGKICAGWLPKLKALDHRSWKVWGTGVALVVALAVTALVIRNELKTHDPVMITPADANVTVRVSVEPSDAELRVDDLLVPSRNPSLVKGTHNVSLSRVGFKPLVENAKSIASEWRFVLAPEALSINVDTADSSGEVLLDGTKLGDLDRGQLHNSSFIPDGGVHVLSARNKSGELFRVSFRAPLGRRPVIDPLLTPDLIALSTLGKQASVYTRNSSQSFISDNEPPQSIGTDGLEVDLTKGDGQLRIGTEKHHEVLTATVANAPGISLWLNSNPNMSSVTITTPSTTAALFVDGRKRGTNNSGHWTLKLPAGTYSIKLQAPGMLDKEMELKVGKATEVSKNIEMEPLPSVATMVIRRGTPGAKVYLDETIYLGDLDNNGDMTYTQMPVGMHDITFQKEGMQSRTTRQPFKQGDVFTLPGDYRLTAAQGYVSLRVLPLGASVEYRAHGESQWKSVAGATITLPPGNYDLAARAPSYKPDQQSVVIGAGKTAQIEFQLQPDIIKPPPAVQLLTNTSDLDFENQWYIGRSSGWVSVRPGTQKCTIIFLKMDLYPMGRRKPKHLEWAITIPEHGDRIGYEADAHTLNRKAKIGNDTKSASKVIEQGTSTIYSYVVVLEAHRIQISKPDGTVLDEVIDNSQDWSHGAISIRSNGYFNVRQ